jgi:hypothetical protein
VTDWSPTKIPRIEDREAGVSSADLGAGDSRPRPETPQQRHLGTPPSGKGQLMHFGRADGDDWCAGDVAGALSETSGTADFRKVRAMYEQYSRMCRDGVRSDLVTEVLAELSKAISGVAPSYRHREDQLLRHILAVFCDVAGREVLDRDAVRASYHDGGAHNVPSGRADRRHPGPFEAVLETGRRLRDLDRLIAAMRGTGTSGILCGSMSYGRFYSVRGTQEQIPASDLDIILIARSAGEVARLADRLVRMPGMDPAAVDRWGRRAAIFAREYDDGRTVLSQKLPMWAGRGGDPLMPDLGIDARYQLSLHVLTVPVLGYALVERSPLLLRDTAGASRTVRDYRDQPTERLDEQRTFAGHPQLLKPHLETAPEGLLRNTGAYLINEADQYSPGFLQTMVLPDPELMWDDAGVRSHLQAFRHKFIERLRYERGRDQYSDLRPSYTHPRRGQFALHLIQRFDQEYSPS